MVFSKIGQIRINNNRLRSTEGDLPRQRVVLAVLKLPPQPSAAAAMLWQYAQSHDAEDTALSMQTYARHKSLNACPADLLYVGEQRNTNWCSHSSICLHPLKTLSVWIRPLLCQSVRWLQHVSWPRASNLLTCWCENMARLQLLSATICLHLWPAYQVNILADDTCSD